MTLTCDFCEKVAVHVITSNGKTEALCDLHFRQTRGKFINDDISGLKS